MRQIFRYCATIGLFAGLSTAQADVMYQCIDNLGHRTFSNVKLQDKQIKCTPMELDPATTVPAVAPRQAPPPDFPRVAEEAQKARDNDRRRILETELGTERQNLHQARKELAEQESIRNGNERNYQKVLDRTEPYKEKVGLHERNIEAIEKELAKLR